MEDLRSRILGHLSSDWSNVSKILTASLSHKESRRKGHKCVRALKDARAIEWNGKEGKYSEIRLRKPEIFNFPVTFRGPSSTLTHFPKMKRWMFFWEVPDGWENLGRVNVFFKKECDFCGDMAHIGRENGKLFYFCKRCSCILK